MKTHELTIVLFGSKVGGGGEKAVQKGLMELFEGQVVDTVHRPVHVMSHSLKQKFKGLEPFCCPAALKKKESPEKAAALYLIFFYVLTSLSFSKSSADITKSELRSRT